MPPMPGNEADLIMLSERSAVLDGDREVILTPTQFRILAVLVGEPNRVFSRTELVEQAINSVVEARTVDVHIKEIRRKLGTAGGRFETVRRRGFRYRGEVAGRTEASP